MGIQQNPFEEVIRNVNGLEMFMLLVCAFEFCS